MGEIAEMMLEGTLCIECGVALECDGFGIPILCHDCHSDYQIDCTLPHEGESEGGYMCERYYQGEKGTRSGSIDEAIEEAQHKGNTMQFYADSVSIESVGDQVDIFVTGYDIGQIVAENYHGDILDAMDFGDIVEYVAKVQAEDRYED